MDFFEEIYISKANKMRADVKELLKIGLFRSKFEMS